MCCFTLLCTFKRDDKNYEVKVGVQRRAVRFREKNNNRCVFFVQFSTSSLYCGMVIVLDDYLDHLIVRVCMWVLGVTN